MLPWPPIVRAARLMFSLAVAAAAPACHTDTPAPTTPRPPAPSRVKLRVSTEVTPVTDLEVVGRVAFATTEVGLERWELDGGEVLPLSASQGLPGDRVLGTAPDPDRGRLWVVTDQGLGTYDVEDGVFATVASPPAQLGALLDRPVQLAADAGGGLWLGHPRGLFFVSPTGGWASTPITEPILDLWRDDAGWLWIAASTGLIGRKPDGETLRYGAEHGLAVARPRLLAAAPGGGVLVVGEDGQGRQRLAVRQDGAWASFRLLPDQRWDRVITDGDQVVAMAGSRLYRLARPDGGVRPLARDGARLVPLAAGPSPFVVDPLTIAVPADIVALAAAPGELLLATRHVGIARVPTRAVRPTSWLRRQVMFDQARSLSVACARRDDCWISVGARRAWHWRDDRFTPGGPDQVVLAMVRHPGGGIYALHRGSRDDEIEVSRIQGETWEPVPGIQIKPPGKTPAVSFAHFAPGGQLWLGLQYQDGDELAPWGVAVVDLSAATVTYHHATSRARDRKAGQLPVPLGANDIAFVSDREIWFATSQGAARMAAGRVDVWSERDNLPSDLFHGVTASRGGRVFVASSAGVGVFDGTSWSFPPTLAFAANDVALADSGVLWMATERGLASYDGRKLRRLDTRRGLVESQLLDLALDQFGRIWARGPGSLVVLQP